MRCPCCGCEIDPEPAVSVGDLRDYCRQHGLPIFPGGRVSELVAAELLGKASGTLKNWRCTHGPAQLPYVRSGGGRGRISYRLADLADFLRLES